MNKIIGSTAFVGILLLLYVMGLGSFFYPILYSAVFCLAGFSAESKDLRLKAFCIMLNLSVISLALFSISELQQFTKRCSHYDSLRMRTERVAWDSPEGIGLQKQIDAANLEIEDWSRSGESLLKRAFLPSFKARFIRFPEIVKTRCVHCGRIGTIEHEELRSGNDEKVEITKCLACGRLSDGPDGYDSLCERTNCNEVCDLHYRGDRWLCKGHSIEAGYKWEASLD
jgi:hypothetical protein